MEIKLFPAIIDEHAPKSWQESAEVAEPTPAGR